MQLRAPVPDDAEAVLAVLTARDVADIGEPDFTLEDVRDEWRAPDVTLADDARLIELNGGVVAYGIVRGHGTLAAVHPAFEGQGVGRRLLEWAEQHDIERGRDRHRQWIAASNKSARTLLSSTGYAPLRHYWRMVRDLGSAEPPRDPPAGVVLRALDVEADLRAVYDVDRLSFADAIDYHPTPFDEFVARHLRAHDLDPQLSFVAEEDDQVAGFLLARRWSEPPAGFVDVLAVHPEHQGRGVGSALLREAFAAFAAAGLREAQLGVASDNTSARTLYERAGMRPKFRFDVYERVVR